MKISRYRVVTPPFLDRRDGITKRVVFAARTAQQRAIGVEMCDRIEARDFASLSPAVLKDLVDIELLLPAEEDELAVILQRNQAAIEAAQSLDINVQPTAQCQLDCDYCGQRHESHTLAAADQDRLVNRTRKRLEARPCRVIRVSWFGGEPLLGLEVMRALAPRMRALAEEFGCEYRSRISTNGLMLSETLAAELVRDLGIHEFQITLDGPARFHDARRHRKGGGGTFEQIFANTVALARREDLGAEVLIRCNIDRRNVDGVRDLIQAFAGERALDRVAFSFVPVHDWGNDAGRLALPKEEFAEREIGWLAEVIALGLTPSRLIPCRKAINCIALSPHAELVDPHGRLFNCMEASLVPAPPPQRLMEASTANPKNPGGQLPILPTSAVYMIGDLASGEQPGRRRLLGDFNARVARGEYPCATCKMLPVCGGACPKLWLEGRAPCPSAKYNIEARLLLSYAVSRLDANLAQD
jgi:uncharacterized protein